MLLLRLVERVVAEAARNRMFLESASDGITILDEQGRVVEANRQFAAMLDRTPEEVASMNVTDWNAQFDADTLLNDILRAILPPGPTSPSRPSTGAGTAACQRGNQRHLLHLDGRNLAYCASRDIAERNASRGRWRKVPAGCGRARPACTPSSTPSRNREGADPGRSPGVHEPGPG